MRTLLFRDLGTVEYPGALALQEALLARRQTGELSDVLLVLEHSHVFTLGRGGNDRYLIDPGEIPVYHTSRGGDITYHGPGQIVFYPIVDLRSRQRREVHRYLQGLEAVTVGALSRFGISAQRLPPWTGVWIEKRKIASMGIAVRKGVSWHGIALNVSTNLDYFARIIPCGLSWAQMTSMEKELGRKVSLDDVKEEWVRLFIAQFGYERREKLCPEDILIGLKSERQAAPTTSGLSGF
jgi:lipoate-protein ligase B